MSELKVSELDHLVQMIHDKRNQSKEMEAALSIVNTEITALEVRAAQYLNELERDNFRTPFGMITLARRWRVNVPTHDKRKQELFAWLNERGIFEKYATVNSNSLNSLYMAEWKVAQEEGRGMEFVMPGVEAPKLFETVKFIKGAK